MAKPQILEEVGKVSELKTDNKTVVSSINEVLEKEKSNEEQINALNNKISSIPYISTGTSLVDYINAKEESNYNVVFKGGILNDLPSKLQSVEVIVSVIGSKPRLKVIIESYATTNNKRYSRDFYNGSWHNTWRRIDAQDTVDTLLNAEISSGEITLAKSINNYDYVIIATKYGGSVLTYTVEGAFADGYTKSYVNIAGAVTKFSIKNNGLTLYGIDYTNSTIREIKGVKRGGF